MSSLAQEVVAASATRGLGLQRAIAEWALGLLDLGLGRPAQAVRRLARVEAAGPGGGHPFIALCAAPDLIESAVRAGRPDDARAAWARLARFGGRGAPAWALPLVTRCRALLAPRAARDRHFRQALASAARAGARSTEPAPSCCSASICAARAGAWRLATIWMPRLRVRALRCGTMGRARAPRAARRGQTARKRDPSTVDQLTAQEVQIARFVARGATNREVAAQLFLSKRTVDYHLRRIFAKLAISSRNELATLELEAGLGA